MMCAFEFKRQRKKLAEELIKARKEDGVEKARDVLKQAQATPHYSSAKTLHRISRAIPKAHVERAIQFPEREDDPNRWDVQDISDNISAELKFIPDAQSLADLDLKHSEGEYGTEVVQNTLNKIAHPKEHSLEKSVRFLDELTEGRFMNRQNWNHVVGGQVHSKSRVTERTGAAFDRHSRIFPSRDGPVGGAVWFSSNGSEYAKYIGKPLIIISPHNVQTRRFIENTFKPQLSASPLSFVEVHKEARTKTAHKWWWAPASTEDWSEVAEITKERVREMMVCNREGKFIGFSTEDSSWSRYLFLCGLPIIQWRETKPANIELDLKGRYEDNNKDGIDATWMEIADCIVDLRQRKMWTRKYSEEEMHQTNEEERTYRAELEKMLGCTVEKFIEGNKRYAHVSDN